MHELQIFVLVLIAMPIAVMSWILWKVTAELGDFDILRRKPRYRESPIRVRTGNQFRITSFRTSRF